MNLNRLYCMQYLSGLHTYIPQLICSTLGLMRVMRHQLVYIPTILVPAQQCVYIHTLYSSHISSARDVYVLYIYTTRRWPLYFPVFLFLRGPCLFVRVQWTIISGEYCARLSEVPSGASLYIYIRFYIYIRESLRKNILLSRDSRCGLTPSLSISEVEDSLRGLF